MIYTCDQSKAIWYTRKKGLADVLEMDEKTGRLLSIKLKFKTRSKTKICMNWQLGRCGVEHCPFAHGVHEIKVQPKHSEVLAARRQMAKAGNPSGEDDGADDDEMDEEDDFIDDYEEAAAAIHIPDLKCGELPTNIRRRDIQGKYSPKGTSTVDAEIGGVLNRVPANPPAGPANTL